MSFMVLNMLKVLLPYPQLDFRGHFAAKAREGREREGKEETNEEEEGREVRQEKEGYS